LLGSTDQGDNLLVTWLAIKEFCKKAWKFVVDQWLFFLTAGIGILGFILGTRGDNSKEVLDLRKQGEEEERTARKKAQERTEEVMKILSDEMSALDEKEKEAVGKLLKENAEEFEEKVIENRDKPLKEVVNDLASKYGLDKV
tara:strand:+ start:101 stop:526 length:426 start_codon:yes stop_codon:yes gene_type:complete